MAELLSQMMSPLLKVGLVIALVLLVALYVVSIAWVMRDAHLRGANSKVWGIVAIIPVAGIIAYCLMRPPLLQIDQDEQKLEIALKQRELLKYGECGHCGYPVESDYVMCPNCLSRLKNLCPTCNRALDPAWTVCPYCTTQIMEGGASAPRVAPRTLDNRYSSASNRGVESGRGHSKDHASADAQRSRSRSRGARS